MKLSVILPCFNGAATIAIQLEALANQQWSGEWEVIVSNNGSTDDSIEIVERYRDRLPNLRIVNAYEPPGPRLPVAHSYNVGIQAATGDAFAFCEADDEVASGWVAAMGEALSRYEIVSGPLEYSKLNEPWLVVAANEEHLFQSQGFEKAPGSDLPFAFGCNFGMRRSVYERIGELDEVTFRCAWDADYCWKAQLAGIELHFIPDVVVHYRLRHELDAIYRQGCNWGKEGSLLYLHYSEKSLGWSDFFFSLKLLVKSCWHGIKLYLMRLLDIRSGKGRFASWYWMFGFQLGFMEGTLKYALLPNFAVNPVVLAKRSKQALIE